MLTGQYPHNNGVVTNDQAGNINQDATIQRFLHDAGYVTAIAGKYLNRWDPEQNPSYFDRWAIHLGTPSSYYFGGTWNQDGVVDQIERYSTDFVADKGQMFLRAFEENDDQPWFIYLTPFAPHFPSQPEGRYTNAAIHQWDGNPAVLEDDLSDKPPFMQPGTTTTLHKGRRIRRSQLRTLMSVDDLVGSVFNDLETLGEVDETLAILTSDNGYLWGEHRLKGKTNLYEQTTRIPMMLRWPGVVRTRHVDSRLAANIDLGPTILAAAGIEPDASPSVDGLSLLEPGEHEHIILSSPEQGGHAIRTLTYQYNEYYSEDGGELLWSEYYDLVGDPWQLSEILHDTDPANDPDTSALHEKLSTEVECKSILCS
jgi:arylsulfatase A-like enzyme